MFSRVERLSIRMDYFPRGSASAALTVTLNELILLNHGVNRRPMVFHRKKIKSQTTNLPDKSSLPAEALNNIKLMDDLKYIVDAYSDTLAELRKKGTFESLLYIVSKCKAKSNDEENLLEEHRKSLAAVKDLKARLIGFKSEAESKLIDASQRLNSLKSDWRLISKVNQLEYELVKKWEYTRYTQAKIAGEKKENILKESLLYYLTRYDEETCVISNFKAYSELEIQKYREMIEMWKERYAKEMGSFKQSIEEKEKKISEVKKSYEKHFEIDCKRRKFIKEYLEQKAEQERLLQLQIKRIESAVRIQAWWKGVMVRRCLGPYRKKTKKGKKSKKDK